MRLPVHRSHQGVGSTGSRRHPHEFGHHRRAQGFEEAAQHPEGDEHQWIGNQRDNLTVQTQSLSYGRFSNTPCLTSVAIKFTSTDRRYPDA